MLRLPNQRANQIRRSYKNEEFDITRITDEVYNQMSHLLSIRNVFVSAIFRLITNCTRDMALAKLDVYCLRESTNCTRNSIC